MATIGIHLVWTTYGTWLPGDPRGHWSPLYELHGEIIKAGGQLNPPDSITHNRAKELLKDPIKTLDHEEIDVVAKTISELVEWPTSDLQSPEFIPSEFVPTEQPRVFAAAIEPTHVHLLIGPIQEHISRCGGRFKGRTSSAVLELRKNNNRSNTWTKGFWKVFLFDELAFFAVKKYIEKHNLRRGLPPAPYEWIWQINI